jgi:Holliday junction DNA helicase RuvA
VIDFLEGEVVELTENSVVLAVNGVGYRVAISKATVEALRGQTGPVKIYTHLHYTPNDLALYGFATPEERQLFELLILSPGSAPKSPWGFSRRRRRNTSPKLSFRTDGISWKI